MEVNYDTDTLTGRVTRIELRAATGAEELFLTAVEKVLSQGESGERLTARFRTQTGNKRQLSWLPKGKKKEKPP